MSSGSQGPYDHSVSGSGVEPLAQRALPRTGEEERRRMYLRRRLAALAALIGLLILLVSALGGSGGHRRAVAHPVARRVLARPLDAAAIQARDNKAIRSVLAYTPYIIQGQPRRREVALTFDDGPGPYTPQVLGVLLNHHVPATFFVVGSELKYFGGTLPAELSGTDYVVGDHTENHRFMSSLSPKDQVAELTQQAAKIHTYGAPFPHLFRPPYGSFDQSTIKVLHRYGMLMVLWSVDTEDYRQPGVDAIVQRALHGAKPGAIILMHDAGGPRSQTVAALPLIIQGLRRRHLRPVTVPQLLADDPPDPNQPPPRALSGGAG